MQGILLLDKSVFCDRVYKSDYADEQHCELIQFRMCHSHHPLYVGEQTAEPLLIRSADYTTTNNIFCQTSTFETL